MPTDCKAWKELGIKQNGVYPIKPDSGPAFQVYCDMETDGGGWAVFQRRQDGSVDFYRGWTDYENGFGQTIRMREERVKTIMVCPDVRPQACPPDIIDCKSLFEDGNTTSGVYTVNPDGGTPFEVYCDMETDGGGWTVFQGRQDGSVYFYRNWTDYENGFGDLTGEFWLGLSKIHRLTKEGSNTLRVDLEDFDDNTTYANYSTFNVITIDEGEGSYCMADCTGNKHEPSLYIRTCCNSSNLGQTIRKREGRVKTIMVCPDVRPQACPPLNCKGLFEDGNTTSGVYTVNPDGGTPFEVYCDMETDGGGWTVFQRRQDGSVDFYRYWTDYENGFGDLTGEFWLGLSKIHRLTKEGSNTLRVDLGDFEGNTTYANYSTFNISDGSTEYILTVGGYSGTAGDSLAYHNGSRFSTKDNDNDDLSRGNCAQSYTGAWWYHTCYHSSLNGQYFDTSTSSDQGIKWWSWKTTTLQFSEMKTRRNN
uniref:Fibrinogen C-terminal domain-containing protein n=1 Tax=Amphimedon queenslandica TaxID=400682 RepID=A0A1X7UMG7_AMPQE